MSASCSYYKLLRLLAALASTAFAGQALGAGGIVDMSGSIIDAPCSIDVGDQDQSVALGTLTTGEVIHSGYGFLIPIHIHFSNCSLESSGGHVWSRFSMTFDGINDGRLFGVMGAKGIGIRIADGDGNIAYPGIPLPAQPIIANDMALHFSAQVASDNQKLVAGDWHTIVHFKIDYN